MSEKKDSLQRFIFEHMPIRGELIHLESTYQTIIEQHSYPPVIRRLLGEALCIAGLLTAIIKFQGRLTVQFRGRGNLKLLLAQCDDQFNMRGLVKWEGEFSYDELMSAFNEGTLAILLDSGAKNYYQSIVSWRGNSLNESIESYFRESEQLPTRLWLNVNAKAASGFLLQIIPSRDENPQAIEEKNKLWQQMIQKTDAFYPRETLEIDHSLFLSKLYPEEDLRLFPPVPVSFKCPCTRARGEEAILLLGRKEAEEELKNKRTIMVTCDFCSKEYIYDRLDVKALFENNQGPSSSVH